jgi:hypothetical protein
MAVDSEQPGFREPVYRLVLETPARGGTHCSALVRTRIRHPSRLFTGLWIHELHRERLVLSLHFARSITCLRLHAGRKLRKAAARRVDRCQFKISGKRLASIRLGRWAVTAQSSLTILEWLLTLLYCVASLYSDCTNVTG